MCKNNRLLIIGNGFDLSLGLSSKFSDFLSIYNYSRNSLRITVKECKQYYVNDINHKFSFHRLIYPLFRKIHNWVLDNNDNKITDYCYNTFIKNGTYSNFWAMYMYLKKKEHVADWDSVEDQMYKLLSGDNLDILRICYEFYNLWPNNDDLNNCTIKYGHSKINLNRFIILFKSHHVNIPKAQEPLSTRDINIIVFLIIMMIMTNKNYEDKFLSERSTKFSAVRHIIFSFLKEEEYKFELSLNNYLIQKVNNYNTISGDTYWSISRQLLMLLAHNKPFSLLNFNYTNPFERGNHDKELFKYSKERNIHGVLTNVKYNKDYHRTSPIIGISDRDIDITNPAYRFTKNYRILRLSCNDYNDIFNPNIKQIEFFGHSLDPADYSYFRDIFDFYNIKECHIKLIFYYICHGNKTDDQCAINQINNIILLFKSYCGSSKEAKELIHTLSLRGKIEITNLYDKVNKNSELGKQLKHINDL